MLEVEEEDVASTSTYVAHQWYASPLVLHETISRVATLNHLRLGAIKGERPRP